MSLADMPGPVACPACLVPPDLHEKAMARAAAGDVTLQLSLPGIHCAACISTVERGLAALPGVSDVRVNLTRKRAVVRARPGLDPDRLVQELARLGYDAQPLDGATLNAGESDRAARDLMMRLGVAFFAMMNVMLLSVAVWSGADDATRQMFHWISAAIALPTVAFSGRPFFVSALSALRAARLNMDVPISLALVLACGMSLFETIVGGHHAYFDAALSLTYFLLVGRYLDQKMRSVARSAATELAAREAPMALLITADGPQSVALPQVAVGDLLLVRPGAKVPVDGEITEGRSEIDRAFLTGETEPVSVAPGTSLHAGEINLTGTLTMRAAAVGKDTLLHSLAALVTVAEQAKTRYNSLADRAARIYAPLVHILAFAAFLGWMLVLGDMRFALNVAVAVLIITCPCALGLAVPAVSTVASGRLFRRGLLVKHETALERLAEVDEVVLDKTGTLTLGLPRLLLPEAIPDQTLALAAALAQGSAHPRSTAIVAAAQARGLALPVVTDIREQSGQGITGLWQGRKLRLGRADWADSAGTDSGTVFVSGDGPALPLAFEDVLRPGAAEMIAALRARGLPVTLLSGDTAPVVQALAEKLGITAWQAGVLPQEKAAFVAARRDAGRHVLMVGDGLNDTAALAMAHVSIAPASALEATRVAADLVLLAPRLTRITDALRLAQSARRRILENFGIAAVYNVIAVPLAIAGLATPLAAAIAMSSSSIIVSLNALRVR